MNICSVIQKQSFLNSPIDVQKHNSANFQPSFARNQISFYAHISKIEDKNSLQQIRTAYSISKKNLQQLYKSYYSKYWSAQKTVLKFLKTASGNPADIARRQIEIEKKLNLDRLFQAKDKVDEKILRQKGFIRAVNRAIKRLQNPEKSVPLRVNWSFRVGEKSGKVTLGQIKDKIVQSGYNPNDVFIRFFDLTREDLVRIHGTDRQGLSTGADCRNVKWDTIWKYHDFLLEKGLKPEDGLYLTTFKEAEKGCHVGYLDEFFMGNLSLAIYDKDSFRFISPRSGPERLVFAKNLCEFACFKKPDDKQSSLIGIVTPLKDRVLVNK